MPDYDPRPLREAWERERHIITADYGESETYVLRREDLDDFARRAHAEGVRDGVHAAIDEIAFHVESFALKGDGITGAMKAMEWLKKLKGGA